MRRKMLVLGAVVLLCLVLWQRAGEGEDDPALSELVETVKQKEHRRVVRRTGVRGNADFDRPRNDAEERLETGEAGLQEPEPGLGMIVGKVVNAHELPEGAVWVSGSCVEGVALTDADGDFFSYAQPGACFIQAHRKYGLLRIWSEPVEVEVLSGEEVPVFLEVPPWKPAGLGISLNEDEYGISVEYVYPGSPAEQAGLQAGDVITEIDGVAAADLSIFTFIEYGMGEEGTDVDLVVESDEFERSVTVTRGLVERP